MIPFLEPLTHNKFTVKDSFSFAKEIAKYDNSLLMESLDVVSLFTNILFQKQIDGVAMGSPLGPTLANTFLCHYKKEWLDNCPSHFKCIV